ncbi:MAG: sigma-70 family RNA polymerase sigma factor [Deltaproteobacteria bacterium]|nr:sigma-70 family RNA polymerase sigma factor [Deltaproteobacteria bacterium]
MQSSEADLIQRFLDGEEQAVQLVDSWISQAAWGFRQRLSRDWEDVFQEIRLELTRLLIQKKFRGESSLKTYLWRVVNHTCIDRVRALSRWRWEALDDLDHRGVLVQHAKQGDRKEFRDLMLRVVEQSSEECRKLWRLVLEGYSYREMSESLGVAEPTLRVRVLRCRKKAVEARDQLLDESPES